MKDLIYFSQSFSILPGFTRVHGFQYFSQNLIFWFIVYTFTIYNNIIVGKSSFGGNYC